MNKQLRLVLYILIMVTGIKLLASCSTTPDPESPPLQEQTSGVPQERIEQERRMERPARAVSPDFTYLEEEPEAMMASRGYGFTKTRKKKR